jgi:adenylate cyclase
LAKPASVQSKAFRHARLWVALLIAALLGAVAASFTTLTPIGRALELKVSDALRTLNALPDEDPSSAAIPITVIAIDDPSIRQFGHWPWPWDRLADLVDTLKDLGARLIVLDIEFPEPDPPHVVEVTGPDGKPLRQIVETVPRFVESVRSAGNVLVPFSLYIGTGRGADELPHEPNTLNPEGQSGIPYRPRVVSTPPSVLQRFALESGPEPTSISLQPTGYLAMIPALAEACAGSGYTSVVRDPEDGVVRRIPLLIGCGPKAFPHLALAAAAQGRLGPGYHVQLAGGRLTLTSADGKEGVSVPVDEGARMELRWPKGPESIDVLPVAPILDLARQRAAKVEPRSRAEESLRGLEARLWPHIADHLCIVGLYATASTDLHTTPTGKAQPGVTVYPAVIRTILSGVAFGRLAGRQEWFLALLAAALVAATVRLSTGRGAAGALLIAAAVVAAAVAAAKAALLLPVAGPVLAVVVAFAGVSGYRQLTEVSSRRWITRVFQQYTSAEHVEEILRHPERLRLGGERREVTVLFSDLAGFTSLSEQLPPERLVALLNHYLSAMTEVLLAEQATLDKYEGDGILAFFGAPVAVPDHARRAVRAALAMQAALPRVMDELVARGLLPPDKRLAMRIGCATGPAIVGNFGSERRFDYTAMGDTVNIGGRLEEANRYLASRILVPESTRAACAGSVLFRRFGRALLRGKAEPMLLYEPLALEPAPADPKAVADAFGRAVDAVAAGDLAAAEATMANLLASRPDDGPGQVLKERIAAVRAGRLRHDEPWNLARSK